MTKRTLLSILLLTLMAAAGAAEVVRFKPAQGYQTYAVREPVLRINPGDTLETNTLYSDFFTAKDGPWPGEVGPIYVNGAMPEDTLVIKILKIRPNIGTGRSGTGIDYGSLTATDLTPMLNPPVPDKIFIWRIDAKKMTAALDVPGSRMKRIEVKLRPMLGRLATAPPDDQAIPAGVPS